MLTVKKFLLNLNLRLNPHISVCDNFYNIEDDYMSCCTRFHGHFSNFATKSFTAEADLQANMSC